MKHKLSISIGREFRFGAVYSVERNGLTCTFRGRRDLTHDHDIAGGSARGRIHLGVVTGIPAFGGGYSVRGARGRFIPRKDARQAITIPTIELDLATPEQVASHNTNPYSH